MIVCLSLENIPDFFYLSFQPLICEYLLLFFVVCDGKLAVGQLVGNLNMAD